MFVGVILFALLVLYCPSYLCIVKRMTNLCGVCPQRRRGWRRLGGLRGCSRPPSRAPRQQRAPAAVPAAVFAHVPGAPARCAPCAPRASAPTPAAPVVHRLMRRAAGLAVSHPPHRSHPARRPRALGDLTVPPPVRAPEPPR